MPVVPLAFLTVGFQSAVFAAVGLLRVHWLRYTLWTIPGCLVWAALPADQVVVVVAPRAAAVDGLAVDAAQHIHLTAVGQRLQRPVDGGQPDLLPAFAQQLVQVLGRAEVVDLREQVGDGGPLPGHPLHHRSPPEVSTTSSAMSGWGSRPPLRRARTRSGRTAATSAYRPMARTTMVAPGEASWK